MKILLSAYACEPRRGSEPGVGWNWALALARRGHEVWVITRSNNRQAIESEFKVIGDFPKLHFVYFDLGPVMRRFKKTPGGVYWYYILWQFGIVKLAKTLHATESFDLAHHITFGVFRHPSFLTALDIPLVVGPVGGGERTPRLLRHGFGLIAQAKEQLRDIGNWFASIDPTVKATYRAARMIVCKTPETRAFIPPSASGKCVTSLEIGIDNATGGQSSSSSNSPWLLFVGRFIYWKGGHLAIKAFAQVAQRYPDARLTMVGKGPQRKEWRSIALALGLSDKVIFVDWMPQRALQELYQSHDIFLFPSLHDSSGNVVLEALSFGLPVVCLNLGGPPVLVDESCGRVVPVDQADEEKVVARLAETLVGLFDRKGTLEGLRAGALQRAKANSWDSVVDRVYRLIEAALPSWQRRC